MTGPDLVASILDFDRDIRPGLYCVTASQIHEATGLSVSYAAQIRRGDKTPHRRHWKALKQLAAAHWEEGEEQRRLEELFADIDFDRDVRPALEQLRAREVATEVGLSRSYVSQIQSGRRTPSIEYWEALLELVELPARAT